MYECLCDWVSADLCCKVLFAGLLRIRVGKTLPILPFMLSITR